MKDVPAAVAAIAIAIAGVAVEDAARAAVLEEVTVVATPAAVAADVDEGRIRLASCQQQEGPQRCGPFSMCLASSPRAGILEWRGHSCPRALEG